MKHYLCNPEEVLEYLHTGEQGLSSQEAAARAQTYGANKLADPPKTPLWKKFLAQFADPMIIVLPAHAVLNLNAHDGGNRKFILVEMEDYAW